MLLSIQSCTHTCNDCRLLSGDGGSLKYHQTSIRKHPNCNENCPGHEKLRVVLKSNHDIIRILLVLPPEVDPKLNAQKLWPNMRYTQRSAEPAKLKSISEAIPGFSKACHYEKRNKILHIYDWVKFYLVS